MKQGLISVILPVWKPNLTQLKQCINSIVLQTYPNLELIIAYLKSPEFDNDFYNLIKEYNDNRIKVIECKIKGIASQLNEGIQNSTGEFIARIDGDDFCEINRFERQLEYKKTNNCNIVGSWANYVLEEEEKIWKLEPPVTHQQIRKKMMHRSPIMHVSVLMDRAMLDDIGLYDSSLFSAEDYELWFRAMYHGYRFGNVPEYLVNIRFNPESSTRGAEWKKHRLYTIKVKNKALLHYGFFRPIDIFYYLQNPFYYFISPKLALKARKKMSKTSVVYQNC